MNIGFTYDLETLYTLQLKDPPDALAEFDRYPTIALITKSLAQSGNTVVQIGNVHNLLAQLDKIKKSVDIVFNIAEGRFGRNRESQIPVILELMEIPFVGSDGLTQSLTLDKLMTKKILTAHDLPTPKYIHIDQKGIKVPMSILNFPLIVKPRWEGSSMGITKNSRVANEEQLTKQVNYLIETYRQPAIIEEFIKGDEYTVAIIGNGNAKQAYIYQLVIGTNKPSGDEYFLGDYILNDEVTYLAVKKIDLKLNQKLLELACDAYDCVGCLDFGRIDFRVDQNGRPYILEINTLPSLNKSDAFGCLAKDLRVDYATMIQQILQSALQRHNMSKQRNSLQPLSPSHFPQLYFENSP